MIEENYENPGQPVLWSILKEEVPEFKSRILSLHQATHFTK
jgi:hypothetical protein